jgi:hypothetical protein
MQWGSFLSPSEPHLTACRFKYSHTWGSHSPLVCPAHICRVWGGKFCFTTVEERSFPQSCECWMLLFIIMFKMLIDSVRECMMVVLRSLYSVEFLI